MQDATGFIISISGFSNNKQPIIILPMADELDFALSNNLLCNGVFYPVFSNRLLCSVKLKAAI